MQIGEPFYLDITANSSEPDTTVSPELKKKLVENFSTEPDNRSFTDDLIQSFKGLTGMGSEGDAPESTISPDVKKRMEPALEELNQSSIPQLDDFIQAAKDLTGMGSKGDAPESAISPDEKIKILPDPPLGHRG